MIWILV